MTAQAYPSPLFLQTGSLAPPRLLVSVRDAEEAERARSAGADVVDAKDPADGPLGALSVDRVRAIVNRIGNAVSTSAVVGKAPTDEARVAAVAAMAATGVDFVKIAVAPTDAAASLAACAAAARGRLIGVLFAEDEGRPEIVAMLADAGFRGAMIDTRGKDGRPLTEHLCAARLSAFVGACRRNGLLCGLAGSLRIEDIAPLARHAPDYLGFRGGLCRDGDRRNPLDGERVRAAARALRAARSRAQRPDGASVPARPLSVLKVGGSLLADPMRLKAELTAIADGANGAAIVVPGGGPFADAVRVAQAALAFDDGLAHRLALKAMCQMAEVLRAIEPRLRILRDADAIEMVLAPGAAVWTPDALLNGHRDIPERWDVTSDSIALWLATRIEAERCILIKSAPCPSGARPDTLAQSGLVDGAFPTFAKAFRGDIIIRNRDGDVTIIRDDNGASSNHRSGVARAESAA